MPALLLAAVLATAPAAEPMTFPVPGQARPRPLSHALSADSDSHLQAELSYDGKVSVRAAVDYLVLPVTELPNPATLSVSVTRRLPRHRAIDLHLSHGLNRIGGGLGAGVTFRIPLGR